MKVKDQLRGALSIREELCVGHEISALTPLTPLERAAPPRHLSGAEDCALDHRKSIHHSRRLLCLLLQLP